MTPIERAQIDAARRLLDEVLRLDATAAGEPGEMPAPILAACVILDPLLEATHQGTCYAAALAGDAGQLLCAVTRAQSQIAQIDTSGTRPPADLARIGYEAYAQATGGLTFDGRQMPTFDRVIARDRERGTKVSAAWAAAAVAIRGAR